MSCNISESIAQVTAQATALAIKGPPLDGLIKVKVKTRMIKRIKALRHMLKIYWITRIASRSQTTLSTIVSVLRKKKLLLWP